MTVLIPAYKPDEKLVRQTEQLRGFNVLIVDDGSGEEYADIFRQSEAAGANVLKHDKNRGKGAALKTGINYLLENMPREDVVTADADGQHLYEDIVRLAEYMERENDCLVIGERNIKEMPLRSKTGNTLTRIAYSLVTRKPVSDTQTGLRGIPAKLLRWAAGIDGDRYEYEMNMLLSAAPANITIKGIPITTKYIDNNKGSHFHGLKDGARIYRLILKHASVPVIGYLAEYVLAIVLLGFTGNMAVSVLLPRLLNIAANILFNKNLNFRNKGSLKITLHYSLSVLSLLGTLFLFMLLDAGFAIAYLKPLADLALFIPVYFIEKKFIYMK